jgi:hypothetical protein
MFHTFESAPFGATVTYPLVVFDTDPSINLVPGDAVSVAVLTPEGTWKLIVEVY